MGGRLNSIRISIALCTYNGAGFLKEMLDSLAEQVLRPAELIVCDDASSDSTCEILEEFAQHASFPVHIHVNPARLNVVKNFEKAIRLCSGQVIALSDQDDIWHPEKLQLIYHALASESVYAVFSDAYVVSANLDSMGYTMWQRVGFSRQEQKAVARMQGFNVFLRHNVVTGATLAFKSDLLDAVLPIPDNWPHDSWLALMAAAHGEIIPMPDQLVLYRQHEDNVVSGRKRSFLQEVRSAWQLDRSLWYQGELARWRSLQTRLSVVPGTEEAQATLQEKLSHLEARAQLPAARWRRFPGVIRELATGRYARFSRNWGSVAIDMLVK